MNLFPSESAHFLLDGPVGAIEVAIDIPRTETLLPITFVMCHPNPLEQGTMNNKVVTTACAAMNRLGIPAVRFNFRGVGQSEGQYGETIGEGEDLDAVMNWLKLARPGPIWLGGFSFGTLIAYRGSARHDVDQLLTIAPANDRYDYPLNESPNVPWMVILAGDDEIVSMPATLDFIKAVPVDVSVYKMAGASHFFHRKLIDLRRFLMCHYAGCAL